MKEIKNNILIHIPHSSVCVPTDFKDRLLIEEKELELELNILTDMYAEDIFFSKECNMLVSEYSRIFFDVERFREDKNESMSKIGMGAIYSKTIKGKKLLNIDNEYREYVLNNYYDKYHNKFETFVESIIDKHGTCQIIDAHSFSKELVNMGNLNKENIQALPDFCLGYDIDFVDYTILNKIKEIIIKSGYSVKENFPCSGSIVPIKYYNNKDTRVKSIMIEINKELYLSSDGSKNKNYKNIKRLISNILSEVSK